MGTHQIMNIKLIWYSVVLHDICLEKEQVDETSTFKQCGNRPLILYQHIADIDFEVSLETYNFRAINMPWLSIKLLTESGRERTVIYPIQIPDDPKTKRYEKQRFEMLIESSWLFDSLTHMFQRQLNRGLDVESTCNLLIGVIAPMRIDLGDKLGAIVQSLKTISTNGYAM